MTEDKMQQMLGAVIDMADIGWFTDLRNHRAAREELEIQFPGVAFSKLERVVDARWDHFDGLIVDAEILMSDGIIRPFRVFHDWVRDDLDSQSLSVSFEVRF